MKFVLLVLLAVAAASALKLSEQEGGLFNGHNSLEFVIETTIGGLDLVTSQLISLEHNKIRNQYTTFNGDVPAFDEVLDFTNGQMWQYFNLTGECKVYEIPKMCLTAYLKDLLTNHTEFAGYRGEHLELYEVKHPEDAGSRSWVYGVRVNHTEGGHSQEVFVPARLQSHRPSMGAASDYSGDFLDIPSHPIVTNSTFRYPACEGAHVQKLDAPLSVGFLGALPRIYTQVVE